ncbi:Holliday junction resolvase RuvX [Candidatus Bipolaricaulota bacterium]|nr:Holliday junction resolvase RuvX [Candidatus Bipolaricaulota bacterium]
MKKGKILGLDWGSKRIGIAISDREGNVALGRPSHHREDLESDLDYLEELVEGEDVSLVVIGMPFHMNGGEGQSAEKVREFKQALEERLPVPVDTMDERLTSSEAERVMIESDLRREERKEKRDRVAATLILQRYLDSEVE